MAGLSDLLQVCLSWGHSLKSRLIMEKHMWAPQPPHLLVREPRDTIWERGEEHFVAGEIPALVLPSSP